MSFEEIFRRWEKRNSESGDPADPDGGEKAQRERERLESLLDQYPPDPAFTSESEEHSRLEKPHPRTLPIDDELDLHGMTVEEATAVTQRFIESSLAAGHRKVLIVHGKGLHSQDGGVLKQAIRRFLEKHPDTGAMGTPKQRDGGSGASWVMLRYRSR
ncbi:MAG: Smr/MutS family protein [Spirochaetia bacterium]